ncbi:MAG: gluconate 2-dehydrogenase subunit 3 family protein [Opitutae bacterium]
MNRRESIVRLALLMGGTVVGPRLLRGAENAAAGTAHGASPAAVALLDEIGDTIIPPTDVPGAKAVNIGAFIARMVRDCYEPDQQAAFHQGVQELAAQFRARHGREFVGAPADLRTELLNELNREQVEYTRVKVKGQLEHYFRLLKELTILGYFSSEVGCTQAIRFIEVPGSYSGDVPYKPGDHVWFS